MVSPPEKLQQFKSLRDTLQVRTRCGELWKKESPDSIRCFACGHRCRIYEGRDGICKVRSNVGGELRVPWGYVAGLQSDPIEKKPFFHVAPGARALSFGMLGCDFHCGYCQNWFTSQTLRDPESSALAHPISADELCSLAEKSGAKILTSTYNEPLITSEWAVEIFKAGKRRGLRGSYVSNGNGTREVLEYLRPYVDFYKVDLKSFRDRSYRQLGGVLKNVTDSIADVYQLGMWLEIVTLVIPGFNDDPGELRELAQFLVGLSPDIPWHVTAFHQDYKMTNPENTPVKTLLRAAEIGRAAGLNFIYLGNVPGQVGEWEDTRCAGCRTPLVRRRGYHILENKIQNGKCPHCQRAVPGVWEI